MTSKRIATCYRLYEVYDAFSFADDEEREKYDVLLQKLVLYSTNMITCERYRFFTGMQEPRDHCVTFYAVWHKHVTLETYGALFPGLHCFGCG